MRFAKINESISLSWDTVWFLYNYSQIILHCNQLVSVTGA